ncbi:MAG: FkbM family methyltransferase [Lachnospiraceae bacterium]|nr:FkbM family methyltransferase [Candidatus Colinaster equi]
MNISEKIDKLQEFRNKLCDDESKRLFDIRFDFMVNRDVDLLERMLCNETIKYSKTSYCYALEHYFTQYPEMRKAPIVVFGAGKAGARTIRTLKFMGMEISHVVDNNYSKVEEIEGIIVENPAILATEKDKNVIIISVFDYQKKLEIFYQLFYAGIKLDRIFMPKEGGIWCDYGNQYFDLDNMRINEKGEIFLDAGCYNGVTSIKAKEWCNNRLNKVYAFEPDGSNYALCDSRLRELGCEYELIRAATWSERTELHFEENDFGQASKVCNSGLCTVQAESIDNVLSGKPVTYIKLDVEGSELETLKGAEETIRRYRPKLAVSIYHKAEDIMELPLYIDSLGLDYKYYIRHYQSRWCETTLYAI